MPEQARVRVQVPLPGMPTAPPDLARGVAADYGMLVAALITVGLIMWRDRTSSPACQTVTAGPLLALMIAWSGHEDVLTGLALVLVVVSLAQAIKGHPRPPHEGPTRPPGQPAEDQLTSARPFADPSHHGRHRHSHFGLNRSQP
jgi:hypothetical protein